jgi:hypothetical protein
MEFKGFDFLSHYGTTIYDQPGNKSTRDINGVLFSNVEEPYRLFFQKDGAKEFPVSQIIAYRWHIRPPYRQVSFPQLDGVQVYDLFCPECDTGVFSSIEEQEAVELLRQHLTTNANAAHSYRPEDLRALGQEYGVDFFAPRRLRMAARKRLEQQPSAPAPEPTAEGAITCRVCGQEFASYGLLGGHTRTQHPKNKTRVGARRKTPARKELTSAS